MHTHTPSPQLLTAVGALTGCLVSLFLGGAVDVASKLILPFTAGHNTCSRIVSQI